MDLPRSRRGSESLTRIYKILGREAWVSALESGVFSGSAVDLNDGFIHFSTADQAMETARRHFTGQPDLVVLAIEADSLGADLKWEPSRGGVLFPHLHADLPTRLVLAVTAAPLGTDGVPHLGDLC